MHAKVGHFGVKRGSMYDMYLQGWLGEVNKMSDGRLYKYVKEKLEFEQYLNMPNKMFRTMYNNKSENDFTCLIERGRWANINR